MGALLRTTYVCLLFLPIAADAFFCQSYLTGAGARARAKRARARRVEEAGGARVGAGEGARARSGTELALRRSGDNGGDAATRIARHATTRSGFLELAGAAVAGTLAVNVAPCGAAARSTAELVRLLCDAKKQLEPVDALIDDAKWDAIRNIIKTSPLADVKNIVAELAKQAGDDESALLLGLRQDLLDHVQYLDSFSYNNVFVGEERQILGTKIDFDTPRMELRQAREAFDVILEVLPPGDDV